MLFLGGVGEVAGPQGQVVSEELHDGCGISVLVLLETVQVSDRVVEGSLRQFAGMVGRVQDLVVEHGVV